MSFLGYIGKTLGAGTAPIYNANLTSQSDINYREFRDNAPNRAREEALRMAGLERTEAEAQADEAETKRIRDLNAASARRGVRMPGGVAGLPMPPGQASDAPIDIPPVPTPVRRSTPTAAVPVAQGRTDEDPESPNIFSSIKSAFSGLLDSVRAPSSLGYSSVPVPPLETVRNERLKEIDTRINDIRKETKNQKNLNPSSPLIIELNSLEREKRALKKGITPPVPTPVPGTPPPVNSKGVPYLLADPSAAPAPAPLLARIPAAGLVGAPPAAPARAPAPAPAPAAPARAPAPAAPARAPAPAPASFPKDAQEVDPVKDFAAYTDPGRKSYDELVVENELIRLEQYRQDVFAYADRTDRASMTTAFLNAKAIEDEMIVMDGKLAKLQIVQAVTNAMGGVTGDLNIALSAALGAEVAINAYRATDRTIVFQPTINGELQVGTDEYLTKDEMRLYSMRMIDAELDKQLTQNAAESEQAFAEMYFKAQLDGNIIEMQMNADMQTNLQKELLDFDKQKALKMLERELTGKKMTTIYEFDGGVVSMAEDGTIYRFTETARGKGKNQENFTVVEEVFRK